VIALAKAETQRLGRPIGLYPETKHPTFFLHEGRHLDGPRIALDTSAMLLDELVASEFTDPACVYIQSFEIDNLQRLSTVLMPAAGLRLPLVFLLGDTSGRSDPTQTNFGQPFDVVWFALQGEALRPRYGALAERVPNFGAATHYGQLLSTPALQALRQMVDGLGVWIPAALQAVPALPDAVDRRPRAGLEPAPWLAAARALDFAVHAYTVRDEAPYRLLDEAGLALSTEALIRQLHAVGATGVFADQPALAVAVRDALSSTLSTPGCA
jgi:glycerophosphoryl diester phosphodiesterase